MKQHMPLHGSQNHFMQMHSIPLFAAIYSSAHSSRSGTANGGYSHQPSPISMSHSMASSPMVPMNHSPYPVQHSPMSARMQPSPGPQMQQTINHPTMMQHSPLPAATEISPPQPQLLHQHSSVDYRYVQNIARLGIIPLTKKCNQS